MSYATDRNKNTSFFNYDPTSRFQEAKRDSRNPFDEPTYRTPLDPEDAYDQSLKYLRTINRDNSDNLIDFQNKSQGIASDAYRKKVLDDSPIRSSQENIAATNALGNVGAARASGEGSRKQGEAALLDALNRVNPSAARAKSNQIIGKAGIIDETTGIDGNGGLPNPSLIDSTPRFAGTSSSAFGLGGISGNSPWTTDYNGARRINTNYASDQAAWNLQQNRVIDDMARISKAQNAGNLDSIDAQAAAALRQSREDAVNAQNLANAQASNQRQLAGISAASQERIAKLQAQGGVFSSLFGGLSSGSQNYRYW